MVLLFTRIRVCVYIFRYSLCCIGKRSACKMFTTASSTGNLIKLLPVVCQFMYECMYIVYSLRYKFVFIYFFSFLKFCFLDKQTTIATIETYQEIVAQLAGCCYSLQVYYTFFIHLFHLKSLAIVRVACMFVAMFIVVVLVLVMVVQIYAKFFLFLNESTKLFTIALVGCNWQ